MFLDAVRIAEIILGRLILNGVMPKITQIKSETIGELSASSGDLA